MKTFNFLVVVILMFCASLLYAEIEKDNFSVNTIGTNWSAATNQFVISGGALWNNHTTGWGLAVYKNVKNPTESSIKWTSTSTDDGVNAAGFALFLDSSDHTKANGYFVFIRNGDLTLTAITNGQIVRLPELAVSSIGVSPKKGDLVKVVHSLNQSTRIFKFYINGSLVGTVSTNQAHGSTTNHYAGIVAFGRFNGLYVIEADEFSVNYPALQITSPNGGEEWSVGDTQPVVWNSSDFQGPVKVELENDDGIVEVSSSMASVEGENFLNVNVTEDLVGIKWKARVTSIANNQLLDESDDVFIIKSGEGIFNPIAGEIWVPDPAISHTIKWGTVPNTSVNVHYKVEDGADTWIAINGETDKSSMDWKINDSTPIRSENVKIKISLNANDEVLFTSSPFTISPLAQMEVKSANGKPGGIGKVVISLKNYVPIRGIQLIFEEDGSTNLTYKIKDSNASDYKVVNAIGRAAGFMVTAFENNTNQLNILLADFTGGTIAPDPAGSPILEIPVDIEGDAQTTSVLAIDKESLKIIDTNNKELYLNKTDYDPQITPFIVNPDIINGNFYFITPGDLTDTGDVNNSDPKINDQVNIHDYDLLLQHLLDPAVTLLDNVALAADLNVDGQINIFDLMMLWDLIPVE